MSRIRKAAVREGVRCQQIAEIVMKTGLGTGTLGSRAARIAKAKTATRKTARARLRAKRPRCCSAAFNHPEGKLRRKYAPTIRIATRQYSRKKNMLPPPGLSRNSMN